MATYHVNGIVEYTSVYTKTPNGRYEKKVVHAFARDISGAETPQEAFEMTEQALIKKYTRRPSFVNEHKDIRITYCKVYELKEVFEIKE